MSLSRTRQREIRDALDRRGYVTTDDEESFLYAIKRITQTPPGSHYAVHFNPASDGHDVVSMLCSIVDGPRVRHEAPE